MLDPTAFAGLPMLDTSMSQLATWSRCDRKYFYRHVRGLVPKGSNDALQWGTLFHAAAQEYYRALKRGVNHLNADGFAKKAINETTVVKNDAHGDTVITLDAEQREKMGDCWEFYRTQNAVHDQWDEIVAVEDPLYFVLGINDQPVMRIRSTIDALVRKNGKLVIIDHKTTGDIEQNLEFLALDFQVRMYALAAKTYYKEDAAILYNMVGRDVPPGFGHRPLTTETGRARSRETLEKMQEPSRYLRREWLTYNDAQLNAFQRELGEIAITLANEKEMGIWPRRRVSGHYMSCSACDYFAICSAEADGREIRNDNPLVSLAFTRDPKTIPQPSVLINPFA